MFLYIYTSDKRGIVLAVNSIGSNNLYNEPYKKYDYKAHAQNNADDSIFSSQSTEKTDKNIQENNIQTTSSNSLREELEQQKKDQGIISKAWDGIKNFFGAKNSSSNVEATIEKFEKGEISEEEARQALDEYKNAQNTFTDKLSGIISTAGLIGAVAGAVLSFIPGGQVIGLPLLAISGKVALGGMFVDNALNLVDNSTDKDGLTKDELKDLAIETGVEAAAYMVGRGIGKLTGNIHTNIANKLVSKGTSKVASQVIGYASEAATDGALSLGADYGITQTQSLITTGKTVAWKDYWSWDRFTSEGRSQLIGILTGVATSKQYPAAAIAPAAAGAGIAAKEVKANVSVNKAHDMEVQTNAPRRLIFNPETGELTPAKPQSEIKIEPLDHPVAGDNVGVALNNTSEINLSKQELTVDDTKIVNLKTQHDNYFEFDEDNFEKFCNSNTLEGEERKLFVGTMPSSPNVVVNEYLRKGIIVNDKFDITKIRKIISDANLTMEKFNLEHDTVLYRNTRDLSFLPQAGEIFVEKGFTSTSASPELASLYGPLRIKIYAKKGTKCIPKEQYWEIMLKNNSQFRVLYNDGHYAELELLQQ